MSMVLITGNTFPVKDKIKALGGKWDAMAKGWNVPAEHASAIRSLVLGAPKSTFKPRKCKCGQPLTGRFFKCRDCYYHDQECDALGLDRNWDA